MNLTMDANTMNVLMGLISAIAIVAIVYFACKS